MHVKSPFLTKLEMPWDSTKKFWLVTRILMETHVAHGNLFLLTRRRDTAPRVSSISCGFHQVAQSIHPKGAAGFIQRRRCSEKLLPTISGLALMVTTLPALRNSFGIIRTTV